MFITLEGIEGAGKSTAIKLIESYLAKQSMPFILTREPGGTEIAEKIREVVLRHHIEKMCPETELLLFFAARAQHLTNVILPALQQNKVVVCDRFTDTTYAYQGAGHNVSKDRVAIIENWVQGDLRPDLTIILDVPVEIGLARTRIQNNTLDRIASNEIEFFKKVRAYYLQMAKDNPQRYKVIDATRPLKTVENQILEILKTVAL